LRRDDGLLFDAVAEEYDSVRPSYPPGLVDRACTLAGVAPGARVLEIGCGTGKLTRDLLDRGLVVDAVDPGGELVAVARRLQPGPGAVRFHVSRFEDVELPPRSFAGAFAASAFHWIDPGIGWAKVAQLLAAGGLFALLGQVVGFRAEQSREVEEYVDAAWREVVPERTPLEPRTSSEVAEAVEAYRDNVADLWAWLSQHELGRPEARTLYDDVRTELAPVQRELDAERLLALTHTTAMYLGLDPERRTRLDRLLGDAVDRAGGRYTRTDLVVLVTARAR
jgi:SAM-dependent methyltransferase